MCEGEIGVEEREQDTNICPRCGQHFGNHNDDGSCVEDETDLARFTQSTEDSSREVMKTLGVNREKAIEIVLGADSNDPDTCILEYLKEKVLGLHALLVVAERDLEQARRRIAAKGAV